MLDFPSVKSLGRESVVECATQIANQIDCMLFALETNEWAFLKDCQHEQFKVFDGMDASERRDWCMQKDYQFACKCVMLDALKMFVDTLKKSEK